jgi:hypothetical protein
MVFHGNPHCQDPLFTRAGDADHRVFLDPGGALADCESELRVRLALLAEERRSAREIGLDEPAYYDDLELEVADTRFAHAGALILQLAFLHAEVLSGRGEG